MYLSDTAYGALAGFAVYLTLFGGGASPGKHVVGVAMLWILVAPGARAALRRRRDRASLAQVDRDIDALERAARDAAAREPAARP